MDETELFGREDYTHDYARMVCETLPSLSDADRARYALLARVEAVRWSELPVETLRRVLRALEGESP